MGLPFVDTVLAMACPHGIRKSCSPTISHPSFLRFHLFIYILFTTFNAELISLISLGVAKYIFVQITFYS